MALRGREGSERRKLRFKGRHTGISHSIPAMMLATFEPELSEWKLLHHHRPVVHVRCRRSPRAPVRWRCSV